MRFPPVLVLLSVPVLHICAAETIARPALVFSEAFGGTGSDIGIAVASDSAGNVYVAGNTDSADFPVKGGVQSRIGGAALRASTDNGNTWSPVTIPDSVYAVAGSAKAPGVLYAGASSAIYKSVDSGKTWAVLPAAPRALVNALIVDSTNPAVVYAGTAAGVFKSQDAGATWVEIGQGGWSVVDLVANPARPSTLFAGIVGSGSSLYRSTDAGAAMAEQPGRPLRSPPPQIMWLSMPLTRRSSTPPRAAYSSVATRGLPGGPRCPSARVCRPLPPCPETHALVFVGAIPGQNIFVTKWSGDGKQTIYSTYLGGSYYDYATGIAVFITLLA